MHVFVYSRFYQRGIEGEKNAIQVRRIPVCGGALRVTGFIAAHPVQFVIDTILSYRVYQELNRLDEMERLTADGVLKGLDAERIEVVGTATLDFYLGEVCVRQQIWIAEIKEDYILGADFLMKQECVIDYPQNVLRIGSTEVPMHANTDELKRPSL